MANRKPSPKTRFKKGQSGNPGGRPKGRSVTAIVRELLDADTFGGKKLAGGKRVADLVAERIVAEAVRGKFPFAREILERLEGKTSQPLDVTAAGDLFRTVLYLPENGRDNVADAQRDPAEPGPTNDVPVEPR